MKDLEKNTLDLAYHKQLYLLNFILISIVGLIVSLLIGIVIHPKEWFNYAIAFVILSVLAYVGYIRIDEKLKKISIKIRNLK